MSDTIINIDVQKEILEAAPVIIERGGGGDKNFVQTFNNVNNVVVTHNLNKYPAITVVDVALTKYVVDIQHDTLNQCTVSWTGLMTGKVICN